jgi:hypothetical protein
MRVSRAHDARKLNVTEVLGREEIFEIKKAAHFLAWGQILELTLDAIRAFPIPEIRSVAIFNR